MYFKIVQCYVNKNEMIPKITLLIFFFRYKVLGMVLKEMVRKFMGVHSSNGFSYFQKKSLSFLYKQVEALKSL